MHENDGDQVRIGLQDQSVREFYVYVLSSHSHRLYVGVTNHLERRLYEHVHGWSKFTSSYNITQLVYFETFPHPMSAIRREKAIKRLARREKIKLIESRNPLWIDLAAGWFELP